MPAPSENDHVQVSADGGTVWVHAGDGSTVGRFSKRLGMDVHTTVTQQLDGADQCLHCTHKPATGEDWATFRTSMREHYGIEVDADLIRFF